MSKKSLTLLMGLATVLTVLIITDSSPTYEIQAFEGVPQTKEAG